MGKTSTKYSGLVWWLARVEMSNLLAQSGQNPELDSAVRVVQVRDLGGVLQNPTESSDEGVNLRDLIRAVRRRKKLVGITAGAVIALSAVFTGYERIFYPVYQGSFSLLITDPISTENGGGGSSAATGTTFEALARNSTSNDIPTLIEVLRSPVLLKPVAERFELSPQGLANRITISTGGGARQAQAQGVLNVSLTGRNPDEDELLKSLSQTYLQAALQQRQQRLSDGLQFLNKQAPALEKRTNQLQRDLANFRIRHKLLEPTEEGAALKVQ